MMNSICVVEQLSSLGLQDQ